MRAEPFSMDRNDLDELLSASLELHRQRTVREVCDVALRLVRRRANPERAALFLAADRHLSLVGGIGVPADVVTDSLTLRGPTLERLQQGVPLGRSDLRAEILVELGVAMAYPLLGPERELVALLAVSAPDGEGGLDAGVHAWLERLAPLVGSALFGARAHRRAERAALEGALDQVNRVLSATRRFSSTGDVSTLLHRVLDEAIRSVDAEKGSLMLVDDDDLLAVRVVRGLPDPVVEERINDGLQPCARFARGQGVAGKVLESGAPLRVSDVKQDTAFASGARSHVRSILCVPLIADKEVIGVVNITNHKGDGGFTADHERILQQLAGQAAAAIRRTSLLEAVILDATTRVYVKPFVQRRLVEEAARAGRYSGGRLSLLALQVDDLTRLRTRFGDESVRQVLGGVGAALRRELRDNLDLAGYLGGGRFHIILPETDVDRAMVVARRLAAVMGELALAEEDTGEVVGVSVSVAAGQLGDVDGEALAARVDRALDEALVWGEQGAMVRLAPVDTSLRLYG